MTLASGGGVPSSHLWYTSQLLRPSGHQCSHTLAGSVHKSRGDNVGAVEMMCVVYVSVTKGE